MLYLLNNFGLCTDFTLALDDNERLCNGMLYTKKSRVNVDVQSREILNDTEIVVITAYLHQRNIRNRLTNLGYNGTVITPLSNMSDCFQ